MRPDARLSAREVEVVRLIACGMTNSEIGTELYMALDTVKTHIRHALQRTGARDRAGLVTWACWTGVVDLPPT